MLKEKPHQPRNLYSTKLAFKSEGEIKTFPDKEKLREFALSRPSFPEILKEVLQRERKLYMSETWIYMKKGRTTKME